MPELGKDINIRLIAVNDPPFIRAQILLEQEKDILDCESIIVSHLQDVDKIVRGQIDKFKQEIYDIWGDLS